LVKEFELIEKEVKQLRRLIRVDALTNYFNYRYFREALYVEMERTRRTGLPTGLIMIDLDHFKSINDNYGHENGNTALISATQLWQTQIRRIDIPCRYGGEEFAIIIPGTQFAMTIRIAERLRSILGATPLALNGQNISLTASFGVDCFQSDEPVTLDEFVDRTDQYLLKAKRNGRNRVCYDEDRLNHYATEISKDERMQLFNGFAEDQKKNKISTSSKSDEKTKD
jgi:diguanylate cyclase (GGDEF)-like protein